MVRERQERRKFKLVFFKLRVSPVVYNERSLWISLGVCEHLWHLCLQGSRTSIQMVILVCNYRALNCIQPWFASLIISTFPVQEAVDTVEAEVQVPAAVEIHERSSCF